MLRLISLLLLIVPALAACAPATPAPPTPTATLPPTPAGDVCSENPAYAGAIAALDWWAANRPDEQIPMHGSHAVLDSIYAGLLAEGEVEPVPPPCVVTARVQTAIWDSLYEYGRQVGMMQAGDRADLYGRSEDWTWFNVLYAPAGYVWVRAAEVDVQPGTAVGEIPIH